MNVIGMFSWDRFEDLSIGDVFIYDNTPYMKTLELKTAMPIALDLFTGRLMYMDDNWSCTKCPNATLVINPKETKTE